jgi:His-Xaa-Ser system radical SAM maturase HxsC
MKLHARGISRDIGGTLIGRVATTANGCGSRGEEILYWRGDAAPECSGYLAILTPSARQIDTGGVPIVSDVRGLEYLADGDVVAVDPTGFVRTLYRKASRHNFLLATDQCNSYCLMCSQPPKQADDFGRMADHFRVIDLIDPATAELGITGGEPTLYGDRFVDLIAHCKGRLPDTALHVLTNGRMFFYRRFAERLAAVGHPDLVLGIPLYSDVDSEHDFVVQVRGAFEQTVIGLLNLDRHDVKVELRVVLHAQTVQRLPRLAEMIVRNFPFVFHVALMGLEPFGFVHQNLDLLWIDAAQYRSELTTTVDILRGAGVPVSIYNHQLCTIDRRLWPFARKSISDWKNVYLDDCQRCTVREECGGFFESAKHRHSVISPVLQS